MDKIQKLERLAAVARLYYEEDRNQSEIAGMFGISRPMVSKLLKEAKELGVVTIRIAVPGNGAPGETEDVLSRLRQRYGLLGGELVQDRGGDVATNQAVAEAGIAFLERLAGNGRKRFGIGWGHIIGDLVADWSGSQTLKVGSRMCPLIGNGGAGLKNYHSNELVRVWGAQPGQAGIHLHPGLHDLGAGAKPDPGAGQLPERLHDWGGWRWH